MWRSSISVRQAPLLRPQYPEPADDSQTSRERTARRTRTTQNNRLRNENGAKAAVAYRAGWPARPRYPDGMPCPAGLISNCLRRRYLTAASGPTNIDPTHQFIVQFTGSRCATTAILPLRPTVELDWSLPPPAKTADISRPPQYPARKPTAPGRFFLRGSQCHR